MQVQLPWWEKVQQWWADYVTFIGRFVLAGAQLSHAYGRALRWLFLVFFGLSVGLGMSQTVLQTPQEAEAFPAVLISEQQSVEPTELWLGSWGGYPITLVQDEADLFADKKVTGLRFAGSLGTQLPVILSVGAGHPFYETLLDVRVGDRLEVVAANNGRFIFTITTITDKEWQPGEWKTQYAGDGAVVVLPLSAWSQTKRVIEAR
jgi:hypothetical protein